jgi:molybdopterin-binding protein
MAIAYSLAAKNARMEAVRNLLNGGALELLAGSSVLASVKLPNPCGSVNGGALSLTSPEQGTFAVANGKATFARLKSADGSVVISDLTVGKGGGANVTLDHVDIEQGQIITVPAQMRIVHA